jgi:L-asparaginase / beta-aspartyl-peptidase
MAGVWVHGGVSGIARAELPSLAHALASAQGRTALDAVEAALRALEDDPALNAGFGSVLNIAGELELDAGIADGAGQRYGGVANVTVRHPITLARGVLERTPHVLLTGLGARAFAGDMERLPDTTPEQRARWERARAAGNLSRESYAGAADVDTVGAIALDAQGHLAAGSSTGGVFGKMPGRVGDAPIPGAGIYASSAAAALGTGVGEIFLTSQATGRTASLIEDGVPPQSACERVIELLGRRSGAAGGLLALDREGRFGAAFRGGSWAVEGPEGPIAAVRLP